MKQTHGWHFSHALSSTVAKEEFGVQKFQWADTFKAITSWVLTPSTSTYCVIFQPELQALISLFVVLG